MTTIKTIGINEMATDIQPTPEVKPAPIDERVRHPLERLRGTIRKYILLEGLAIVGLFVALWFWIGLLLDYGIFRVSGLDWVQVAPWTARAIVLGLILCALLALVLVRVGRRYWRDFSNQSLALVLERRFPKALGDRLITAVELADLDRSERYGYSREMILETIGEAKRRVDRVPINHVFNWRRLIDKAVWLGVLTIGFTFMVFLGGLLFVLVAQKALSGFAWQSKDVATIWAERNILLQNTPWPRDTYLEFVNFDGEERRVGRDDASPRIEVVAWKWVVADESTPDGWRPVRYGDLLERKELLLGEESTVPALPIEPLREAERQINQRRLAIQTALFAGTPTSPFSALPAMSLRQTDLALKLPADLPASPEEAYAWRLDRVEQVFLRDSEIRRFFAAGADDADVLAQLQTMFEQLGERGTDPRMSRTFRMLEVPDEVLLEYWGLDTDNEMPLKEAANEYTGVLSDLKESVKLRASAGDYTTVTKRITLVPPPQLEQLKRTEFQPAYLYYRPPVDEGLSGLRGLRQEVRDQNISLTGATSLFEIPEGTELILFGRADKELSAASIMPRAGKFPGVAADIEPEAIPLELEEDQRSFSFAFTDEMRITLPTEFDIQLTDTDGVKSRRLIQIRPKEDRPPEVDVAVKVIRKVGNEYMCTPIALIPFIKESRVSDDFGLNRVEYRFAYRELEARAVVNTKAVLVGGLWLGSPSVPNIGNLLYPNGYLRVFSPLIASDKTGGSGVVMIEGFQELWDQRREADVIRSVILDQLTQGSTRDSSPIIQQFDFRSDVEGFDLRKHLPNLAAVGENAAQPQYRVNLTIRATDTNVETPPRVQENMTGFTIVAGPVVGLEWQDGQTATNKEPITLLIVSEADLLAKISEDEETLIFKLEDVVSKLSDAELKLNRIVDILPTLSEGNLLAESTRSAEVSETVEKTFDTTRDILDEYSRILEEYVYNRCNEKLIDKVDTQVVQPLDKAVRELYPPVLESMADFNAAIGAVPPRKPDPEVARLASERLGALVDQLQKVRDGIGEVTTIKKLIELIRVIDKGQTEIGQDIEKWREELVRRELEPKVVSVPKPVINAGKSAKVQIKVQFGLIFEGDELLVKFEQAANSDLKLPEPIKVSVDDDLGDGAPVEFEITAGKKQGEFPVRISLVTPEGTETGFPAFMTVEVK